MYSCVHNCMSPSDIKWLCSGGMQQQQPGTVKHSLNSSLLISRRLTRPRVASFQLFYVPKVEPKSFCASGWAPLSKFLNLPLFTKYLNEGGLGKKKRAQTLQKKKERNLKKLKLVLPRPTTDFFCFQGGQDWITLPSDIRKINTISIFRVRFRFCYRAFWIFV